MRGGGTDYKRIRPVEIVSASSAGIGLGLSFPVHLIETSGDGDQNEVTLADGRWDGERHIIAITKVSDLEDSLIVIPNSPPAGMQHLSWSPTTAGFAVTLSWSAVYGHWVIISGNGSPTWREPPS